MTSICDKSSYAIRRGVAALEASLGRLRSALIGDSCPHAHAITTEYEWTAYSNASLCLDCGREEYALSATSPTAMSPGGLEGRRRIPLGSAYNVCNVTYNAARRRGAA